ncbi:Neurexin-2, partial [Armadillidium vulgare]
MHGGRCQQGWGRFICDCVDTPFIGPICAKDAATLSFNGSQHLQVTSSDTIQTQAEDISFRFKTQRPVGLLMTTWSTTSSDKLELALQSGSLRLTIKIADRDKFLKSDKEVFCKPLSRSL